MLSMYILEVWLPGGTKTWGSTKSSGPHTLQGGPSNQNFGSFTVLSLWCILHGCHLPSPIFVLEKSVQMLGELVSSVDILNELTIYLLILLVGF